MKCPSCKGFKLKPIRLDSGLPARICPECNGLLINLLAYRDYLERDNLDDVTHEAGIEVTLVDNTAPLLCSKCNRIMIKYNISLCIPNKLDLCRHCDEAWLDHNEWQALKHLKLHKDLARIFTEPWQRNIRMRQSEKNYEDQFLQIFGKNDYNTLKNLKEWIFKHEKSQDILRYIVKGN